MSKIGDVTVREVRIPVCKQCNCIIDIHLCSPECELDGDDHPPEYVVIKVYRRTDELIREDTPNECECD